MPSHQSLGSSGVFALTFLLWEVEVSLLACPLRCEAECAHAVGFGEHGAAVAEAWLCPPELSLGESHSEQPLLVPQSPVQSQVQSPVQSPTQLLEQWLMHLSVQLQMQLIS